MIFGSVMIVSPIQDFPYDFLLNFAAEPDRQQPISFAVEVQASRSLLGSKIGFVFRVQKRPKPLKTP
jgi:hypothetical protein